MTSTSEKWDQWKAAVLIAKKSSHRDRSASQPVYKSEATFRQLQENIRRSFRKRFKASEIQDTQVQYTPESSRMPKPIPGLVADYLETYQIGRIRDSKVFFMVRMYLAYFHARKQVISPRGDSRITLKAQKSDLELPTDAKTLKRLYLKYLEFRRVPQEDAIEDLLAFETDLSQQLEDPELTFIFHRLIVSLPVQLSKFSNLPTSS